MDQLLDDLGDFKVREVVMADDRFVLYRARDIDEAVVLLKISRAHATPDDLSALSTDFSVARRFDAPSIPRPIRIDTLKGGGTFQVRQHVPGRPLSEWLEERARPAALGEALEIALAIVRALEPLHARGFAHCDISPDNLLYDPEEKVVYFADCARVREHGAIFRGARRAADNPYLPPEQLLDEPLPVDARTDLFAVGTIFQQLLTGEPPGDATLVDPSRLNLSPALQALLDRLLNPFRDRRYASAAAVRRDLTAYLRDWRGRDGAPEPRTAIPDPSAEIRFPDQVFGRESVRSALYSSFVEAIHGLPTLMLVTGDGGSGKSTIMTDFRRRVRDEGALVLRGGWTVYDRDIPFRGLAPACLQIVEWFSTLEPAERRGVADHLKRTLGTGCGVVTEAFPVLEAVLGIQPPPAATGELERQNRLTYCFTTLLSALGSPERAVVLLLEDLHWADASSLLIVERLPGRSIPAQFLTVATLRTGLDGAAAGTVSTLARSAVERGQTVRTLVTETFHAPDVRAFVAGTLGLSVEEAEPLADLLAAPTLGNPLALRETLSTVMERGLVTFDPVAHRWTWDLDGIRQVHLPDNVGQILANRLSALPPGSLEALRAGACLGAKFRLGDLAALLGRPPGELERVLEQPVSDGFVARVGDEVVPSPVDPSWRFRHDLVRRAAYDGLSAEMRRNFHAARGAALLASHRAGGADEALFEALTHLNRAHDLAGAGPNLALAELNLKAAALAKRSTAYETAADLLDHAEAQFSADIWTTQPSLAFEAGLSQAECAYFARRVASAEGRFAQLLERAADGPQKSATLMTRLKILVNMGRFEEALADGRRCLEVLGLPLPARINRSHLIGPLLRIKMLHRRFVVKSDAPPIAELDARTAAILSCLADMWGPAFWLDENLTGLVVLTLVRLSLSRGNVAASAIGYASYGVFLSTVAKRHRAGREVCRLGVRVAESAGDPVYTARARFMYAAFFGPRDEPVRNALTTFRELVNGCLQCGEYPYAGAAANMFLYYLPVVGLPLMEVESGIREMLGVARHTEQNRVIATVEILRRWIAILEGRAEQAEPSFSFDLSGTSGRRNENERGLFHLFEISLLYLLEDHEGAMRHIEALPGNQMLNGYFGVYYAFFAALVLAKRGARQQPRGAWWRAFRRHRRLVSGEATQSPRNYAHKDLLLAAVEAQIRGRASAATRLFEAAIADARHNGFLQNAAIAAELAGEHADRQGQATAAKRHFRQARLWFHQWGALVKTASIDRRLDDHTGERISTTSSIVREESWPSNASAVLEAARVLSSETDPARLVQRLMTSIVEHTRATRGVLLMPEAGELIVTCEIRGDRSSQVCSAAPGGVPDIPFTIVNYVDRLAKPLRLMASADHDLFGRDPYMSRHPQSAILCVSLTYMRQHLGVLFLERDQDGSPFPRRDLAAAEILASQAAATLTNVREYSERLAALQNQMHPHFLFNALSGIAELTVADPPRAERALLDLAALYRSILLTSREPAVSLRRELDLVESYLALEKVRFGARLTFHVEVRGDATVPLIPPLAVQPLVENSVNHGIALKAEGGMVNVTATVTENRVHIRVADTGAGWRAGGSGRGAGVGMGAVRRRMELFFGNEAELAVDVQAGVVVDMYFPVRRSDTRETTPEMGSL